jgi:hypothetical protein
LVQLPPTPAAIILTTTPTIPDLWYICPCPFFSMFSPNEDTRVLQTHLSVLKILLQPSIPFLSNRPSVAEVSQSLFVLLRSTLSLPIPLWLRCPSTLVQRPHLLLPSVCISRLLQVNTFSLSIFILAITKASTTLPMTSTHTHTCIHTQSPFRDTFPPDYNQLILSNTFLHFPFPFHLPYFSFHLSLAS